MPGMRLRRFRARPLSARRSASA